MAFNWNQFPAENAGGTAASAPAGLFDWNAHPVESNSGPPLSSMNVTPDKGTPGPVGTAISTARDVATLGLGDRAEAALEHILENLSNRGSTEGQKPVAQEAATLAKQREAGQNANPGAELIGTGVGTAANALATEGVMGVAGKVLKAGATAAAPVTNAIKSSLSPALSEIGDFISTYGAKAAQLYKKATTGLLGLGDLQDAAQLMKDPAAMGTPRIVAKTGQKIGAALKDTGTALDKAFTGLDAATDKTALLTSDELAPKLIDNISTKLGELQKSFPAESQDLVVKTLEKHLDGLGYSAADQLKPSDLWKLRKAVSNEGNLYRLSTAPADISKRGVLLSLKDALTQEINGFISAAPEEISGAVSENLDAYRTLSAGKEALKAQLRQIQRGQAVQEASDRAAEILSKGKQLGKYYDVLKRRIPYGLSAVAATHAHLLHNDANYRDTIGGLDGNQ